MLAVSGKNRQFAIDTIYGGETLGLINKMPDELGVVKDLESIDYGNYAVPSFPRFSDYFSTAQRITGTAAEKVAKGVGMADYSHRGFYTAGSNLGETDYPLPEFIPEGFQREPVELTLASGELIKYEVLVGDVADTLQDTVDSAALTSYGVFDEFLPGSMYSMTPRNYDDSANLLLPRAVSYGAGLLNHFFRGELELAGDRFLSLIDHSTLHSLNDKGLPVDDSGEPFGFEKLSLRIKNSTPDVQLRGDSESVPQN